MVSVPFCFKQYLNEVSLSEYRTASKRLGEVLDDDPYTLYTRRNSPVFDIINNLLGELPIVCLLLPFFYSFSNLTLGIPLI